MMYRFSKAFTMIELIFVIVIMGIIGKFGVEFLAQSYSTFIHSKINSDLQANSATAVEFIGARLQHRIKASTIAREDNYDFTPLRDYANTTANILEWIGSDVDGFRGTSNPLWSGVIDLDLSIANANSLLISPTTDTTQVNTLIQTLSNSGTTVNDAAIYFVDPDALVSEWGWDGNTSKFDTQQNISIHPIKNDPGAVQNFLPVDSSSNANTFAGLGLFGFEFYQLAWTAYAVGITDWNATTGSGTLKLWYDYQPWKGERYDVNTKSETIMEDVSSFRFIARESLVKIQVCVKSRLLANEVHSICKEKTIF